MTPRRLVTRGLRFYWRTHLGVAGGAAVGTAVLVGALAVGDSIRASLRSMAIARLGRWHLALESGDRFFRDDLASRLRNAATVSADVSAALHLAGIVSRSDGAARVLGVRVHGIDGHFGPEMPPPLFPASAAPDRVAINRTLADRLRVRAGDEVLLRVEKPGRLSRDAPLSGEEKTTAAVRLIVSAVLPEDAGGRFSLRADPMPPPNLFMPIASLQKLVGLPGRANVLLVGEAIRPAPADRPATLAPVESAGAALRKAWTPADAGLELREVPGRPELELRSSRVFLDAPVERAVAAVPGARGVLAYLVNELRVGNRSTPYSMVAAIGDLAPPADGPGDPPGRPSRDAGRAAPAAPLPPLTDDEILVDAWLAEDIQAKPGDVLEITYFVLGAAGGLAEQRDRFRIRAVLTMEGTAADRELMPDFPGLADIDNCRDWAPGVPIDVKKIRKKDETYWEERRGTPKAFVSLAAGRRMWANRFGGLTAARIPAREGARADLEESLRTRLDPASLGFAFRPVRAQALAAAAQSQDFGQLFIGFSAFLIAAALLLTGLLFVFGVEQRAEEAGILSALGFAPARVRGLFLAEGGALAFAGSAAGAAAGLVYTRAVLFGLDTIWRAAVGVSDLRVRVAPSTVAIGALAGFTLALAAVAWAGRGLRRRPARELLASGASAFDAALPATAQFPRGLWIAAASGAAALAIVAATLARPGGGANAGAFFASGALLLLTGLGLCHALLARLARTAASIRPTRGRLALLNAARRRGRSLAVISLLACGSFLVAAVGANRRDAGADPARRGSGTGGFALWATSAIPIHQNLNAPAGREVLGLDPAALDGVSAVPLRVREGDDASCLNLNRAQVPRILGVRPEALNERRAFTFVEAAGSDAAKASWSLLKRRLGDDEIPAIGDDASIRWALGKAVGDLVAVTDDRGRPLSLRIVGAVADSILQGALVISEDDFIARFPAAAGHRAFLIDAPRGRVVAVASALERALGDFGFEAMPAVRRLAAFHAVENTYLAIFQALGGLGLTLGSLGLGLVVMRNVLERRRELALMRAVGFDVRTLRRLVFGEHGLLLVLGLACGIAAAAVAVIPALAAPGAQVPTVSLAVTLAAIAASGAAWTWLAAWAALRGPLLRALRNE